MEDERQELLRQGLETAFVDQVNESNHMEFIDSYTEQYIQDRVIRKQKKVVREQSVVPLEEFTLQPNSMQVAFFINLQKIREEGERRALLTFHSFYPFRVGNNDVDIIFQKVKDRTLVFVGRFHIDITTFV